METTILVAIISSAAVIITAIVTHALSKNRDVDAEWRKNKFAHYQEFLAALSGIVEGDATPEAHRRFAHATNTLHLIASEITLKALHEFRDEIALSNPNPSRSRHDELLSKLVRRLRIDLGLSPDTMSDEFPVRLYSSGNIPLANQQ